MNHPWRTAAACKGLDPQIFYPLEDDPSLILQRKSEEGVLLDRAAAREMVAAGKISVAGLRGAP